ncbi:hypothetical protein AVEN_216710-1 [Araneus ventricosus]|uniref:Uncharacterized protein n=1 Tax=Araneus ventricosus TaxID=182803 RepID=A0A4Y2T7Z6_ARAVE|nr:hypothetical protein AVEN_216710-1 [Araneus ventricosus]
MHGPYTVILFTRNVSPSLYESPSGLARRNGQILVEGCILPGQNAAHAPVSVAITATEPVGWTIDGHGTSFPDRE